MNIEAVDVEFLLLFSSLCYTMMILIVDLSL